MCITMIDTATSWFEIVELPISQPSELDIPIGTEGHKGKDKHIQQKQPYFGKSSATVSTLVNRTWFRRYLCSQCIIYDNGSAFKLHFESLCESYGLKHKTTSVKSARRVLVAPLHLHGVGVLCDEVGVVNMGTTGEKLWIRSCCQLFLMPVDLLFGDILMYPHNTKKWPMSRHNLRLPPWHNIAGICIGFKLEEHIWIQNGGSINYRVLLFRFDTSPKIPFWWWRHLCRK